jgi:hypothetical protein
LLLGAEREGVPILSQPPVHIRGVVIHLWGTTSLITWGHADLPWAA